MGRDYTTDRGTGRVEKINIFSEEMTVRFPSGETQTVTLAEIRRKQRADEGLIKRIERLRR